jgi:molecular chaperone DnaK (HSP70)
MQYFIKMMRHGLSLWQQAHLEIEDLSNGFDLSETLMHAGFVELNNDLFLITLGPVGCVLMDANISKSEVEEIVLVGGSTRLPKVQQLISDYLNRKEPSKQLTSDACRAAVQSNILTSKGGEATSELLLLDVTPLFQASDTATERLQPAGAVVQLFSFIVKLLCTRLPYFCISAYCRRTYSPFLFASVHSTPTYVHKY